MNTFLKRNLKLASLLLLTACAALKPMTRNPSSPVTVGTLGPFDFNKARQIVAVDTNSGSLLFRTDKKLFLVAQKGLEFENLALFDFPLKDKAILLDGDIVQMTLGLNKHSREANIEMFTFTLLGVGKPPKEIGWMDILGDKDQIMAPIDGGFTVVNSKGLMTAFIKQDDGHFEKVMMNDRSTLVSPTVKTYPDILAAGKGKVVTVFRDSDLMVPVKLWTLQRGGRNYASEEITTGLKAKLLTDGRVAVLRDRDIEIIDLNSKRRDILRIQSRMIPQDLFQLSNDRFAILGSNPGTSAQSLLILGQRPNGSTYEIPKPLLGSAKYYSKFVDLKNDSFGAMIGQDGYLVDKSTDTGAVFIFHIGSDQKVTSQVVNTIPDNAKDTSLSSMAQDIFATQEGTLLIEPKGDSKTGIIAY